MHTVQLRTHNTHAHSLVSFWYDGKCRQTKRIHNIDNSNEENWKMCRDKQKSARREVLLCFWEWNITAEIPSLTTDEKKDKFAKKTNKQQRCTNVNPYSKIHLKPYNCSVRMSKRQTDRHGWRMSDFPICKFRKPTTTYSCRCDTQHQIRTQKQKRDCRFSCSKMHWVRAKKCPNPLQWVNGRKRIELNSMRNVMKMHLEYSVTILCTDWAVASNSKREESKRSGECVSERCVFAPEFSNIQQTNVRHRSKIIHTSRHTYTETERDTDTTTTHSHRRILSLRCVWMYLWARQCDFLSIAECMWVACVCVTNTNRHIDRENEPMNRCTCTYKHTHTHTLTRMETRIHTPIHNNTQDEIQLHVHLVRSIDVLHNGEKSNTRYEHYE